MTAQAIIYQNPELAAAYLWTLLGFLAFCLIMGTLDFIKKRKR